MAAQLLLAQAFTHDSYTNEHPGTPHNERLEWWGDTVLQFLVSDHLFRQHPRAGEAELTRRRAALVCNAALHDAFPENKRGQIRTGRGVELNERVVAGVYEAVVGAMALGETLDTARQFVHETLLDRPEPALGVDNPVSEVQEREQRTTRALPVYRYSSGLVDGSFECEVDVWWGTFRTSRPYASKKAAKKAAAAAALEGAI